MRRPLIKLSKNWRDYEKKHPNSKWLVMGKGPSIKNINLEDYKDYIKIGVNDIEEIYKPDYLVIVDRINTFNGKRRDTIINTKCEEIFTNNSQFSRELGSNVFKHQRLIEIPTINIRKNPNLQISKIVCSNNSTFVACDLARFMGAIEINLIGVDFTDHVSLDNPNSVKIINEDFKIFKEEINKRNIKINNLSKISKINTI